MATTLTIPITLPAGEHVIEIVNESGYTLRLVGGVQVVESGVTSTAEPVTTTTAAPTTTLPPEVVPAPGGGARVVASSEAGALRIFFGDETIKINLRGVNTGVVRVMTKNGVREIS